MDDDQRHSILLLLPPLGRLLEEMKAGKLLSHLQGCCLALPLIDIVMHVLLSLRFLLESLGLLI